MKVEPKMPAFFVFFITVLLLQPAVCFAKITTSCDCPPADPMLKKSGISEPKKLRDQVFYGKACATSAHGIGSSIQGLKSSLEDIKTPPNLKTPDEILDYMSCYRESDEEFCHFKNALAPHIALAAESSGLPFSVQACLYFQESKFDPNAKSTIPPPKKKKSAKDKKVAVSKHGKKEKKAAARHAYGYVQFMPETIGQIEPIINGSIQVWESNIRDAKASILEEENKLKKHLSPEQHDLSEKNINYHNAKINVWEAKVAARKVWDSYWDGTEKTPKDIKLADVKNPKIAFAISATKQTYDLGLMDHIEFKRAKNKSLRINQMDASDSAVFLAGAYNAGIGGLASRCGTVASLDECLKIYELAGETNAFAKETWIHMSAIRRCSKKGSTESTGYDYEEDDWVDKKSCGPYECR